MHGFIFLLVLIIISGAIGGLIFSLNSTSYHKISIPFFDKEYNSGFLGHLIIGLGGAFVSTAAAIQVFNISLKSFDNTCLPLGRMELLPESLYLIAFGILGGYSGLKIISSLSNTMLSKLEKQIEANSNATSKLTKEIADINTELKSAETEVHLNKSAYLIEKEKYTEGLDEINKALELDPNHAKAWAWKARALNRINDLNGSMQAIKTATRLAPDNWIYWFNQACYLTLSNALAIDEILTALNNSYAHTKNNASARKNFIESISETKDNDNYEEDLDAIRTTEQYKEFLKNIETS